MKCGLSCPLVFIVNSSSMYDVYTIYLALDIKSYSFEHLYYILFVHYS